MIGDETTLHMGPNGTDINSYVPPYGLVFNNFVVLSIQLFIYI